MFLFFDTETTGFPDDKAPVTALKQPHILQLAAILDGDEQRTFSSINLIINAGCGEVPPDAAKVHGISKAIYEKFGVSRITALAAFHGLVTAADVLIGHNIEFDLKMLKIAYARAGKVEKFTSEVASKSQFCTMQSTTDIVKIPGRRGYKWPKLQEAYKALVNPQGFEGAHDAMADVKACRQVFYMLKKED